MVKHTLYARSECVCRETESCTQPHKESALSRGASRAEGEPRGRTSRKTAPFLSWAGGKQRLVPYLVQFLPSDISGLIYHELFLGAGSLFFAVQPETAFLSDANAHLIDCFVAVRDHPDLVSRYLSSHRKQDSKGHYCAVRDSYNTGRGSAAQAARFIYLNKTCFNGIFRVNQKGEFNVPYGRDTRAKKDLVLPSRESLRNASQALSGASLSAVSYEKAVGSPGKNDFYYLDPPYPPLNGTSYFTH